MDLLAAAKPWTYWIAPLLMLGSVLGRINFKAWIPFVALWSSIVYTVDAFCIWGGGFFAQHGAVDYSGGYVIHLSAGVSGFVAAAVIGPRLQRDREIDAPNNLLMVAVGAGLLWLGWNGFNGGDPYYAGSDAAVAVLAYRGLLLAVPAAVGLPALATLRRRLRREEHDIAACVPGQEVEVLGAGRLRVPPLGTAS